ncbi:MAG: hypothetical protein MZV70_19710 [Desulfobacterales bacterium]|nr:hypothetical protein [Desulfobacterales bacterium]
MARRLCSEPRCSADVPGARVPGVVSGDALDPRRVHGERPAEVWRVRRDRYLARAAGRRDRRRLRIEADLAGEPWPPTTAVASPTRIRDHRSPEIVDGDTEKRTRPAPLPLAADVNWIHATGVVACQEHPPGAVTSIAPDPPVASTLTVQGVSGRAGRRRRTRRVDVHRPASAAIDCERQVRDTDRAT